MPDVDMDAWGVDVAALDPDEQAAYEFALRQVAEFAAGMLGPFRDPLARMRHKMAVSRLELKAEQARRELGDAEIDRRVQAMWDNWQHECATLHEYRREVKAACARHDPPPPHPTHDPDGWRLWRYTRDWKRATR